MKYLWSQHHQHLGLLAHSLRGIEKYAWNLSAFLFNGNIRRLLRQTKTPEDLLEAGNPKVCRDFLTEMSGFSLNHRDIGLLARLVGDRYHVTVLSEPRQILQL